MATLNQILTGLTIIAKYDAEEMDTHIFETEHDQIWAGAPGGKSITDITPEDKETMRYMGWFIANEDGPIDTFVWSHFT
ncbi:hypothetical protein [Xanthocytophaga agilis]|uniref:Uncharacterized protein n=1 Tax=Xanthocytophaga agilis TaxID=3048010 RepID=A0AAE3R461_9BACT|nr:hypothetical protein [Xanthocytophaga agilis]MDJ1503301.1 hypothetical protein [Xanthocytophaga agilis]